MNRLFVLFCIWSILLMYCPSVKADEGQCDALMGMSTDMPVQISPTMNEFLRGVANEIKNQWHNQAGAMPVTVLATFNTDNKKAWHFYPYKTNKNNSDNDFVLKLVEKTLSKSEPPVSEPFGIFLVFDTYNPDVNIVPVSKKANEKAVGEPDIDFGPYMALLQRKIKSNWTFTKELSKTGKTVVVFRVKKDGSVSQVRTTSSSGIPEYDQAALAAINSSSPFLPGPTAGPDKFDIQYTFEYQPSPKSKNAGDKLYAIHMSQPEVIMSDLVNLKSVIKDFEH